MGEDKIACPKCGYLNLPHRTTCKNCGEGLTEEARIHLDVVSVSQKRPVWTRMDWLLAGLGVLFLIPVIYFGSTAVINRRPRCVTCKVRHSPREKKKVMVYYALKKPDSCYGITL